MPCIFLAGKPVEVEFLLNAEIHMKQTWRGLHESLGSLRGAKLDAACACGGSQQIQGCTSCLAQCLLHREQDYTLICQPRDEPALGRIHQQRGATLHQHPAHVLTRDSGCTEQHTSRRGDATPTCPRCARSQILHHCLHVALRLFTRTIISVTARHFRRREFSGLDHTESSDRAHSQGPDRIQHSSTQRAGHERA